MERRWTLYTLLILSLCACTRGAPVASSTTTFITIRAPSHILDAIPSGRTACFGLNVSGPGIIPTQTNACSPSTGILAGYVPSGQDVSVNVPSNTTINIELYLYLVPASASSQMCPTLMAAIPNTQLPNTYLIGSAANISAASSQVSVDITANFPSTSQNITQQLNLPTNCQVASAPNGAPSPFTVSAGGVQTLAGSGMKMNARAGETYGAAKLTGGTGSGAIQLIVR